MLKDRRHILLKDNQYSNTLVEPIEITSLESLGISITKGETVGLFPGFIVRDYSIDTEHKKIRIFWFFRKFVESTEKNITIFISAF